MVTEQAEMIVPSYEGEEKIGLFLYSVPKNVFWTERIQLSHS